MATGSAANVDLAYMDQSRPDLQVVKCVVVGDMGVGKTRLICARACGTRYELPQLLQTHVPTVWAIDHYRKDREVLNRSWCTVDDVRVSLRLWDTFGYHDKDRRFAYGRADVILLCFSLVRPRTLKSTLNHWLPEIRRLCGALPIVLCGTQADLRYLYRDPNFTAIDKGPFFREILDEDIITPEKGRAVAKELGAFYYETSVLEQYGINDVFMNVIRAALTHKREKHFWNTMLGNLKRIKCPQPQPPLLPAMPPQPQVHVTEHDNTHHLYRLLEEQSFCDVIFLVRGVCIQAHKAVLICAHPVFKELFLTAFSASNGADSGNARQSLGVNKDNIPRGGSSSLLNSSFERQNFGFDKNSGFSGHNAHHHGAAYNPHHRGSVGTHHHHKLVHRCVADTAALLDNMDVNSSLSSLSDTTMSSLSDIASSLSDNLGGNESDSGGQRRRNMNHPAFTCVQLQQCEDMFDPSSSTKVLQTLVTVSNEITPTAFQNLLTFLYTGRLANENQATDTDTVRAAKLIGLIEVETMCMNCVNDEAFLNAKVTAGYQKRLADNMHELLIQRGFLSDVLFCLEDGQVSAHRALLMARCGMMYGMFGYNFRESSSKLVQFPGVTVATFRALQEHLYLGTCGRSIAEADGVELIELANRMCLEGLVEEAERGCVQDMLRRDQAGANIIEDVLATVEIAQLHNAEQLAAFCLWYLCCNYTITYRRYSKLINQLSPTNQIYLSNNRWPPLWYLKEVDLYERSVLDLERERQRHPSRVLIRSNSDDQEAGCLGFCSRKNRRLKAITVNEQ